MIMTVFCIRCHDTKWGINDLFDHEMNSAVLGMSPQHQAAASLP